MRGWLVGVVAVAGCGRFGFADVPAGDGGASADGARDGVTDTAIDAPPPTGFCAHVPPLATPPTIDGALEAGLVLETLVPVGWDSKVVPLPPVPAVPVQFAFAYRPDGIYAFVDVADPDRFPARPQDVAYCGDGVELYIDHDGVVAGQYDAVGTVQFIARAPVDEVTPRSTGGEAYAQGNLVGTWQAGFVATPRAGGYTFEAFVDAPTMQLATWSLASGAFVGIDLSVNLSTADGSTVPLGECPQSKRLGQFFLRVDPTMSGMQGNGAPWYTPTAFCVPQLD